MKKNDRMFLVCYIRTVFPGPLMLFWIMLICFGFLPRAHEAATDKQSAAAVAAGTISAAPIGMALLPAGSFPANPWGIFDMAGNVWEWVWDVWVPGIGYASPAVIDPRGVSGAGRVFRGGGWGGYPYGLRSAGRDGSAADDRFVNTGFRSTLSITGDSH